MQAHKRAHDEEHDKSPARAKEARTWRDTDCTTRRSQEESNASASQGTALSASAASSSCAPIAPIAQKREPSRDVCERVESALLAGFLKAAAEAQHALRAIDARVLTQSEALKQAKAFLTIMSLLTDTDASGEAKKCCVALLRDLAAATDPNRVACASSIPTRGIRAWLVSSASSSAAVSSASSSAAVSSASSSAAVSRPTRSKASFPVCSRALRLLADVLELGGRDHINEDLINTDMPEITSLPSAFEKQPLSPRAYVILLRRHPYLDPRWYRYGGRLKESPSLADIGEYVDEFPHIVCDSSERESLRPANLLLGQLNTTRKRDKLGHRLLSRVLHSSYAIGAAQAPLTFLDQDNCAIRGISDALLFAFLCDGFSFDIRPIFLGTGPCAYEVGAMTTAVITACNRVTEAHAIATRFIREALPASFPTTLLDLVCVFQLAPDSALPCRSLAEIRRAAVPASAGTVTEEEFEPTSDPFLCDLLGKQVPDPVPKVDPEIFDDDYDSGDEDVEADDEDDD